MRLQLHSSGANASPDPRWALICCYNAASNVGTAMEPAPRWDDGCVLEYGRAPVDGALAVLLREVALDHLLHLEHLLAVHL